LGVLINALFSKIIKEILLMKNNRKNDSRKVMKIDLKKYFPLFLLPTLIAFIIGFVWPFLWGIYLSFFKFKTLRFMEFNGFRNYILAFSDDGFIYSFMFTALFAVVSVVIINLIAFFLAYALTSKIKGTTIFRTIFFMPNLIGGIVLAYVWKEIMNDAIGLIWGSALMLEPKFGFWGLVILLSWQQIGYMMIIYIAGLQAIPTSVMEACQIDGANSIQKLLRVTIPMMMPSITICMFLSITNGFKLFDQNLSLTAGQPMKMSEMMALNIYNTFYGRVGWEGVGQAKAVLFFLLVVGIGLWQIKATRSKEVQQ
jgi:raffinose/stachyose/melibiose transport system permease protein